MNERDKQIEEMAQIIAQTEIADKAMNQRTTHP